MTDRATWSDIIILLAKRFANAITNPMFLISFFLVIIFGGGAGIWIPNWFGDESNVAFFKTTDLLTYGIAILSAIAADGLLTNASNDKGIKTIRLLAVLIGFIAIVMLIYVFKHQATDKSSSFSNYGTLLVLLLWYFVYANDSKYDDTQSPETPIGGSDKDVKITNLAGKGLPQ